MKKLINFICGGDRQGSRPTQLSLLTLRVFTGLSMALAHGWPKLQSPAGIIKGTAGMGFPAPEFFGWAAILAEFVAALLLAIGLGTRVSAFFVAITMAVAAFIRHGEDPFAKQEKALLYLFIALLFFFKGAGKYSVDARIRP